MAAFVVSGDPGASTLFRQLLGRDRLNDSAGARRAVAPRRDGKVIDALEEAAAGSGQRGESCNLSCSGGNRD